MYSRRIHHHGENNAIAHECYQYSYQQCFSHTSPFLRSSLLVFTYAGYLGSASSFSVMARRSKPKWNRNRAPAPSFHCRRMVYLVTWSTVSISPVFESKGRLKISLSVRSFLKFRLEHGLLLVVLLCCCCLLFVGCCYCCCRCPLVVLMLLLYLLTTTPTPTILRAITTTTKYFYKT